jgi:hypothetical protein
MVGGGVRIKPVVDGSISDTDLERLGEELRESGFEPRFGGPPDYSPAPSPWDYIHIVADDAAKAALGFLVKIVIDWAKRRKAERGQRVTIYGPRGEVLKRIQGEGDEAKELPTTGPLPE